MSAATTPVKSAGKTYLIEFSIVIVLYSVAAGMRPWLIAHAHNPSLALAATLAPILPVWLMLAVVWRYYRHIDEYEQKRFLETLAMSFGIGSCALVTYAFLTDAGLPPLALTWAWPTLAASWLITTFVRSIADNA